MTYNHNALGSQTQLSCYTDVLLEGKILALKHVFLDVACLSLKS